MATVYRVLPAYPACQTLATDNPDAVLWRFNGQPMKDNWSPLKVYVPHPNLKEPDIWNCFGYRHVFAFNERARSLLHDILDKAGEQLPLDFHGKELAVLNVTCLQECLDTANSKHPDGLPHIIDEYVFQPGRLRYSLFKIPQTPKSELLTVDGLSGPEAEFKPMVEKHGLKGLRFEKLWSDDPVLKP